jgi:hypothetical protein
MMKSSISKPCRIKAAEGPSGDVPVDLITVHQSAMSVRDSIPGAVGFKLVTKVVKVTLGERIG